MGKKNVKQKDKIYLPFVRPVIRNYRVEQRVFEERLSSRQLTKFATKEKSLLITEFKSEQANEEMVASISGTSKFPIPRPLNR